MVEAKFAFETNADSATQLIIIRRLKMTARLGAIATRVLRDIEEKGYSDRSAPIVEKAHWGGPVRQIRMVRLDPAPAIHRKMAPNFDKLQFRIGIPKRDNHGGTSFMSASLLVSGEAIVQKKGKTHRCTIKDRAFGNLRFLKKRITWESPSGNVHQLYVNFKSEVAQELEMCFAHDLSRALVDYPGHEDPSYIIWNLRQKVDEWILEDKLVQKLVIQIKHEAEIFEVMAG